MLAAIFVLAPGHPASPRIISNSSLVVGAPIFLEMAAARRQPQHRHHGSLQPEIAVQGMERQPTRRIQVEECKQRLGRAGEPNIQHESAQQWLRAFQTCTEAEAYRFWGSNEHCQFCVQYNNKEADVIENGRCSSHCGKSSAKHFVKMEKVATEEQALDQSNRHSRATFTPKMTSLVARNPCCLCEPGPERKDTKGFMDHWLGESQVGLVPPHRAFYTKPNKARQAQGVDCEATCGGMQGSWVPAGSGQPYLCPEPGTPDSVVALLTPARLLEMPGSPEPGSPEFAEARFNLAVNYGLDTAFEYISYPLWLGGSNSEDTGPPGWCSLLTAVREQKAPTTSMPRNDLISWVVGPLGAFWPTLDENVDAKQVRNNYNTIEKVSKTGVTVGKFVEYLTSPPSLNYWIGEESSKWNDWAKQRLPYQENLALPEGKTTEVPSNLEPHEFYYNGFGYTDQPGNLWMYRKDKTSVMKPADPSVAMQRAYLDRVTQVWSGILFPSTDENGRKVSFPKAVAKLMASMAQPNFGRDLETITPPSLKRLLKMSPESGKALKKKHNKVCLPILRKMGFLPDENALKSYIEKRSTEEQEKQEKQLIQIVANDCGATLYFGLQALYHKELGEWKIHPFPGACSQAAAFIELKKYLESSRYIEQVKAKTSHMLAVSGFKMRAAAGIYLLQDDDGDIPLPVIAVYVPAKSEAEHVEFTTKEIGKALGELLTKEKPQRESAKGYVKKKVPRYNKILPADETNGVPEMFRANGNGDTKEYLDPKIKNCLKPCDGVGKLWFNEPESTESCPHSMCTYDEDIMYFIRALTSPFLLGGSKGTALTPPEVFAVVKAIHMILMHKRDPKNDPYAAGPPEFVEKLRMKIDGLLMRKRDPKNDVKQKKGEEKNNVENINQLEAEDKGSKAQRRFAAMIAEKKAVKLNSQERRGRWPYADRHLEEEQVAKGVAGVEEELQQLQLEIDRLRGEQGRRPIT